MLIASEHHHDIRELKRLLLGLPLVGGPLGLSNAGRALKSLRRLRQSGSNDCDPCSPTGQNRTLPHSWSGLSDARD